MRTTVRLGGDVAYYDKDGRIVVRANGEIRVDRRIRKGDRLWRR
jgi:hypothetical protein